MRAGVMAVFAAAACGEGQHPPVASVTGFDELVGRFERARDVSAMRALMRDSVTNGGLWFSDGECAREFGEPGQITGGRLDAFAACLVKLQLRASVRRDALPDVAVYEYAPGFEVEARFAGGLSWIGYAAQLENDRLPTIAASALEALRIGGERDGPIADPGTKARSWLKVCVDENGAVGDVQIREMTSTRVTDAFVEAAKAWRFHPFEVGGRAIAACAMFHMTYPPSPTADERDKLPMPLPLMKNTPLVPEQELHRVAGDKLIAPDDETKTLIQKAGNPRLVGAFKICLDDTGHPVEVATIRSTGSLRYDAKISRLIKKTWVYSPFVIDGKAHAVCTAVTFHYTQR